MTKTMIIVNILGSLAAIVYLVYSMNTTRRDDECPKLVRFEWALLVTLGLNFLDQIRTIFNVVLPISPSGLNHMMVWVSAFLFAHYLRSNFK